MHSITASRVSGARERGAAATDDRSGYCLIDPVDCRHTSVRAYGAATVPPMLPPADAPPAYKMPPPAYNLVAMAYTATSTLTAESTV